MRSSGIPLLLTSLLLITWSTASVSAATPAREKQLVYAISPWTGTEYGETFAARDSDTIYLMAGVANVLKPLETEVYFWEITGEYMVDWQSYKEEVTGSLEILQHGKTIEALTRVKHSYVLTGTTDDMTLVTGTEAETEYDRYMTALEQYRDAVSEFHQAEAEFSAKIGDLARRARETGEAVKPKEIPQPPVQPVMPGFYATQPIESFVLELPEGRYDIRIVDESGSIVPESAKKLVVFGPRRQGMSYEIIPESKWTLPVVSSDSSQAMFVQGETDIYLKLFEAKEFNTFEYTRMNQLHKPSAGQGTENNWTWVHCRELKDVRVQILKGDRILGEAEEKPYYVKQSPGYALGYDIVAYDPGDPEMRDSQPSFTALKLELDDSESYRIQTVMDSSGALIPESVRDILSLRSTSSLWLMIPALFPLMVGMAAWAWRHGLRFGKAGPAARPR